MGDIDPVTDPLTHLVYAEVVTRGVIANSHEYALPGATDMVM